MIGARVINRASSIRSGRQFSANFRPKYGAFVNGQEVFPESKQFFKVYAPATDEVLCEVASTDAKCLNDAVDVADKVFHSGVWSRSDVRYRANVLSQISVNLREAIPELLELEVAQTGRAVREMKAQVSNTLLYASNVR
jgi:acyl-CoA reductase-like NAD-dependent aldehyde dehydrogenase